MAHLWHVSADGEWQFVLLADDLVALPPGGSPQALEAIEEYAESAGAGALLALRE